MAIIENLLTGEKILLKSHHVFGRNREKADTELKNKDVSQIHGSIRWDGWKWMLTDHSRNGIWIDGNRLVPGKNIGLTEGNVIRFSSTEESAWKLIDQKPPATVLIPLQGHGPIIELDRFHALPDDATPDISIYISHTGQWVCENEKGVIPLNSGDIVNHGHEAWLFFCAEPVDNTLLREDVKDIRFCFYVSLDEEHVVVKIQLGENMIDLGERAHHYMLLTLARQRLKDAEDGEDQETQGWIELDRMADMIGLEPCHLNIHIFRVRKQVSSALPDLLNHPQVVERRVGSLRFGYPDFQILRGSSVEGTLCRGMAV